MFVSPLTLTLNFQHACGTNTLFRGCQVREKAKWEKQPTVVFDSYLRRAGKFAFISMTKRCLTEVNLKILQNFEH